MPCSRQQFVAGGIGTLAASSFSSRPAAAQAQFTLKLGHNTPEGQSHSVRTRQMATEIGQVSGGRLNVEVFGSGTLGTDSAILTQVRSGALQMVLVPSPYLGSIVPQAQMDSVPFAYASSDIARAAFGGTLGAWLREQITTHMSLVALPGTWDTGFRQIGGSRPVHAPDDLDGFKIRVPPAKLFIDTFKSLGASPVPVDYAQLYTALQTHIVDGEELPVDFIEYGKLFEVEKYLSLTNHMWGIRWLLVNLDTYNSLPKDLQAILAKMSVKYSQLAHRDTELLSAAIPDKLARRGMVVNTPSQEPFKQKLGVAFYNRWRDEFGAVPWGLMEQYTGPLAAPIH